jgi:hypothetical protein
MKRIHISFIIDSRQHWLAHQSQHCLFFNASNMLHRFIPLNHRNFRPLVTTSRPADTNFYAGSSRRRIRPQADVITNRIVKTLLAPEVGSVV